MEASRGEEREHILVLLPLPVRDEAIVHTRACPALTRPNSCLCISHASPKGSTSSCACTTLGSGPTSAAATTRLSTSSGEHAWVVFTLLCQKKDGFAKMVSI